jgi:hypothetical protein
MWRLLTTRNLPNFLPIRHNRYEEGMAQLPITCTVLIGSHYLYTGKHVRVFWIGFCSDSIRVL